MNIFFDSENESQKSLESVKNVPWHEKHKIQDNVANDPDQGTYRKVPVASFGMKMLERMGFQEGRGIGRDPTFALMKPIEILPRHFRLGLGADPASSKLMKDQRKGMVDQIFQNEKVSKNGKDYKSIDEEAVHRDQLGIQMNSEVMIVKGKHKDMKGVIVKIKGDQRGERELVVQLIVNGENLKLNEKYVVLVSEYKQNTNQDDQSKEQRSHEQSNRSQEKQIKLQWVIPGLKVKVKSKAYVQGKFYNKYIRIEDTIDQYTFTAMSQQDNLLEGLSEKDIKPSLPDVGERAKIIRGDLKGQIIIIESKDKKKKLVVGYLLNNQETTLNLKIRDICGI